MTDEEIVETTEDQGQEETKEQTFHYDSDKMGMVPDDDATSESSDGESNPVDDTGDNGSGEEEVPTS